MSTPAREAPTRPAPSNPAAVSEANARLYQLGLAAQLRWQKQVVLLVLKTAYEYETWLQKHGRGSSYSTFTDEFGFDGHEDRPAIYEAVMALIKDIYAKTNLTDEAQ